MSSPKLTQVFTFRGYIDIPNMLNIGPQKSATGPIRQCVAITSGHITGSGLTAEVVHGGSDWLLLDPSTNVGHLDVRTQLRTETGEGIYVQVNGVLRVDEKVARVIGLGDGGEPQTTQFGDHEFWTKPMMETSVPSLKWVESSVFVGQGRWVVDEKGTAVEYRVFKIEN